MDFCRPQKGAPPIQDAKGCITPPPWTTRFNTWVLESFWCTTLKQHHPLRKMLPSCMTLEGFAQSGAMHANSCLFATKHPLLSIYKACHFIKGGVQCPCYPYELRYHGSAVKESLGEYNMNEINFVNDMTNSRKLRYNIVNITKIILNSRITHPDERELAGQH